MKRNLIYHTHIQPGENIQIRANGSESVDTELNAISRVSLTVKCDQKTLDILLPNTSSVAPKQAVILPVSFRLNQFGDEIDAQCSVVSVRRLSKDIFYMDMKFKEISTQDYDSIDDYIEKSLQRQQRQTVYSQVA
jgi:hypothetical protein